MNLQHEKESFLRAFGRTSVPIITRKKILLEMVANGVAGLCAVLVYYVLRQFIVVKSLRNLWGLAARKDKMLVSKETFEWISTAVIFIVALYVFTYVEDLLEKYSEERQKKDF